MDTLISNAVERPLTVDDVEPQRSTLGCSLGNLCDAFARRVVERYLRGDLLWSDADAAMNHIFTLMTRHCGERVPDYGWSVYLAFDAGEYQKPGGDAVTRPLLAGLGNERSA